MKSTRKATPRKIGPMDFLFELGPAASWRELQSRLASDVALAYLVEANEDKRRAGIAYKLLDGDEEILRKAAGTSKDAAATFGAVRHYLIENRKLGTNLGAPASYKSAIGFDLNLEPKDRRPRAKGKTQPRRFGRDAKNLLTVGLIVRTMQWARECTNENGIGPGAVIEYLTASDAVPEPARFASVDLFKTSDDGFKEAMTAKWLVAPLAAAYLHFVEREYLSHPKTTASSWPKFRSAERQKWRHDIVGFLGVAQWYQEFLESAKAQDGGRTKFRAVHTVPVRFGIKAQQPDLALGRPVDFARHFSIWWQRRKSSIEARAA